MTTGADFARALAAKDSPALRGLLADDVDFLGLTPRKSWEAADAGDLVDRVLLGTWFADEDVIEELLAVDTGTIADRERVSYRFRVRTPDGPHLVEQQAYYAADAGRITWLRVLCSGFRPLA